MIAALLFAVGATASAEALSCSVHDAVLGEIIDDKQANRRVEVGASRRFDLTLHAGGVRADWPDAPFDWSGAGDRIDMDAQTVLSRFSSDKGCLGADDGCSVLLSVTRKDDGTRSAFLIVTGARSEEQESTIPFRSLAVTANCTVREQNL